MPTTSLAMPRPRGTAVHSRSEHTVTVYDQHGAQLTEQPTGGRADLDDRLSGAVRVGRWQPVPIGHVAVVELP